MNHDWLLFLIMAQLFGLEYYQLVKRGRLWLALATIILSFIFTTIGILHLLGVAHD